jgi:hypothetical protein
VHKGNSGFYAFASLGGLLLGAFYFGLAVFYFLETARMSSSCGGHNCRRRLLQIMALYVGLELALVL